MTSEIVETIINWRIPRLRILAASGTCVSAVVAGSAGPVTGPSCAVAGPSQPQAAPNETLSGGSSTMADLQQGRQVVVDRLKRRISQYRVEHNSRGTHLDTTYQAAYETEHKRTLSLNQRQIESKNKKSTSKKEKKLEQPPLSNMGQIKMLARGHEAASDDPPENPSKKPRLSGPTHLMNPSGASSSCSTGPYTCNHTNTNNTIASSSAAVATSAAVASTASAMGNGPNVDISEFQMVQQLQNLKKSDSPAPHMSVTGGDGSSNSMAGNILDTNLLCPLLDDIKKEDGMGGEMPDLPNDLFGDLSNFDGMDLTDIDFDDVDLLGTRPDDSNASGFSLGNDYDALNIGGPENGEATSVSSNDGGAMANSTSPSLQQQTQQPQQLPTVQQSTPSSTPSSVSVPSPASFTHQYNNQPPSVSVPLTQSSSSQFPASSTGLTSSAPSSFQNTHAPMPKVRGGGGLSTGLGGMPPQAGDSPAATTLKNMAQVHQKQHIGPVGPGRPQTFNDFVPYSSMSNSQVMAQNGASHQMYSQGMNPGQPLFNNQSPSSLTEVELKKRHMMHMQHQQQLANSGMQMQSQQSQQQQMNPNHSQNSGMHASQQQQIVGAPSMQHQQQSSSMSIPSSQSSAQISSGVSCGVTNSSSSINNTLSSTPHSIPKVPTPSHMHQQHLNPQLAAQQHQQHQHISQQHAQMAAAQQQGGLSQQQQHGGSLQSQQQQLVHSNNGGPPQPNGPQQSPAHTPSNTCPVSGAPSSVLSQSAVSVGDPQMTMQQQQHQMHMQQIMPMQQQGAGGGPGGMMGGMQGFSRMSPMGTYPGQPGAGAMGQYGAMRGPGGVRTPYHRPSSLSPGAQMAMGADGKMTPQDMFYPSPMGQQFSGMNPGQPPRYPNQMIGPGMMRAMTSSQQHQIMVNQGGQMLPRPPPPEYRHATTIMQQQQMMAQPMPQAMGQGMGQMVYPSMRPGLRPGMGGGSMVSISNGAPTPSSMMGAGGPSPSNPASMGQQPQNLPPSLPAMKPGGASGPVSSPVPTTSLPSSLAMPHPSQASSMAGTMTSPASMSVVGQGPMAGSQGPVASRAAMMQRSCPPNVNVGPAGLVSSQMQPTRPEWSHMMMAQRGQAAGMMMRPSGYPGHPHQQQQGGIMTANSQMMGMQRSSSQMMPMMSMPGGAAAMSAGMQGPMSAAGMQPGMAATIQGPGMVASGMNPGSRMQPGMTGPMGSGQVSANSKALNNKWTHYQTAQNNAYEVKISPYFDSTSNIQATFRTLPTIRSRTTNMNCSSTGFSDICQRKQLEDHKSPTRTINRSHAYDSENIKEDRSTLPDVDIRTSAAGNLHFGSQLRNAGSSTHLGNLGLSFENNEVTHVPAEATGSLPFFNLDSSTNYSPNCTVTAAEGAASYVALKQLPGACGFDSVRSFSTDTRSDASSFNVHFSSSHPNFPPISVHGPNTSALSRTDQLTGQSRLALSSIHGYNELVSQSRGTSFSMYGTDQLADSKRGIFFPPSGTEPMKRSIMDLGVGTQPTVTQSYGLGQVNFRPVVPNSEQSRFVVAENTNNEENNNPDKDTTFHMAANLTHEKKAPARQRRKAATRKPRAQRAPSKPRTPRAPKLKKQQPGSAASSNVFSADHNSSYSDEAVLDYTRVAPDNSNESHTPVSGTQRPGNENCVCHVPIPFPANTHSDESTWLGTVRMGLQMSQSGGGMGGAQVTSQYPGQGAQMNAMGQMGGLQGGGSSPMVPPNQMQGAGGPPHMMGGVVPGARSAGVGGMPSARSPAGMVQMNGGQNHPMSPANMGNMGGSSPASMGGMGQAHSPASMGGMSHPRSPAAMMQHPRSPATMGGPGRPLSNPSMGHSASGGTTPNMLPDGAVATSGTRSNPPASIANKVNPAIPPSSSCSSLNVPSNSNSGGPASSQQAQQQRPPSAGRTSQPPTPNPPTTSNSSPHNTSTSVNNSKNPSNNNTQQQIDHLDINSFFNAPQDFASLLEEHN
ncbi:Neurogenic mastermind-like N-terminal [Trinorchestia longiramus]|nr:Neurogenic mastermind-like N-terminal [Trinorchestia longiramus]